MKGRKPTTIVSDRATVAKAPSAPAWLSKDAKAEWRRIMPLLVERRTITPTDLASVENFCVAIGRVREIERLIQKGGDLDPRLFRMSDKAMTTARQLAAELGLTPVSRSRPAVRDDRNDDDDSSPLDL